MGIQGKGKSPTIHPKYLDSVRQREMSAEYLEQRGGVGVSGRKAVMTATTVGMFNRFRSLSVPQNSALKVISQQKLLMWPSY